MIGAICGQDALLPDTVQIVLVLGGRDACNVMKLPVEMAVVGETILVEQVVERLLAGADHGIGGQMEAQDALELLGIHAVYVKRPLPVEYPFQAAYGHNHLGHCRLACPHNPIVMHVWLQHRGWPYRFYRNQNFFFLSLLPAKIYIYLFTYCLRKGTK